MTDRCSRCGSYDVEEVSERQDINGSEKIYLVCERCGYRTCIGASYLARTSRENQEIEEDEQHYKRNKGD